MGAGIVRTLAWYCFLPAGGKIRNRHLAHHVAEPWRNFHSRANRCLPNPLIEFRFNVEVEVAHRTLGIALVEGPVGSRLRPQCMM
jgi:hypothetical protein